MDNETEDKQIEELLQKPRGHSIMDIFKEVHRQSSMTFFIKAMTKRYPDVTLSEIRENQTGCVFELYRIGEITETLGANILEIEPEEFLKQFAEWLDELPCGDGSCSWTTK